MNPFPGPDAVGKCLFHNLECPVVRENPAVYLHHPHLVMEHFVVKDIFNHVSRNHWAVQHWMNPYDSFVRAISSEAYASGSATSFPRSPGDGTTISASEVKFVQSLETISQVHMLSLRMKTRVPGLCGIPGSPDLPLVVFDEGSQKAFLPDGRPLNERGDNVQHIVRGIKKHLMKPDRACAVRHLTVIMELVLSVIVRDRGMFRSSCNLDSIRELVNENRLIAFCLNFCYFSS